MAGHDQTLVFPFIGMVDQRPGYFLFPSVIIVDDRRGILHSLGGGHWSNSFNCRHLYHPWEIGNVEIHITLADKFQKVDVIILHVTSDCVTAGT